MDFGFKVDERPGQLACSFCSSCGLTGGIFIFLEEKNQSFRKREKGKKDFESTNLSDSGSPKKGGLTNDISDGPGRDLVWRRHTSSTCRARMQKCPRTTGLWSLRGANVVRSWKCACSSSAA